jgi:N-acetylglucosaminyldiphosphoundecaprenol N-acetyl-beta-D-mannosaminyltransferase
MVDEITFFDVAIDVLTQQALQEKILGSFSSPEQLLIATTNPEMLLAARKNRNIARTLRRMTLRIPDGFGISLMGRVLGKGVIWRHPGSDLFVDMCKIAATEQKRVLILGGWGTITEKAMNILRTAFPGLIIDGIGDVTIRAEEGIWDQPQDLIQRIQEYSPDILAVALGGGSYDRQERWIVDHAPQLISTSIVVGIGGTLDMVSGHRPRAPQWMQRAGIEWLWRLCIEPKRIGRIWNAVIRFPVAVILDRINH